MPPIGGDTRDVRSMITELIDQNKVVIFSKTTCPYCDKVKALFKSIGVEYHPLELDVIEKGAEVQTTLAEMYGQKTVPNVFVGGQHVGGCDSTTKLHTDNRLLPMIHGEMYEPAYEYDLVVIGGGSGGLSAAKEAGALGLKVACLDFVKPSPRGTKWGLGGTCVNVGCIPKKLMHQAGLVGHYMEDARHFGWEYGPDVKHNWEKMRGAIQNHIKSLNFSYKAQLLTKQVKYINAYGQFVDQHRIKCTDANGQEQTLTSKYFILATGGRPKYPDIPGSLEYAYTSDDLFSLVHCPGKTLMVGASYVSLECAGFLASYGLDVTVMVRSILLRGFDQQVAEYIGKYMTGHGVKFVRPCVPTKIEKLQEAVGNKPGLYKVTGVMEGTGEEVVNEYNTVVMAVGRDPCTANMNLEQVGVHLNPKTGFVVCGDDESTSCPSIYAVGDIVDGKPELTPVAIQAGKLLVQRLFKGSSLKCDYVNVPTTVFTPLEYGAVGLAEEDAIKKYGENDIEVYHSNYLPLEWTVPHREASACYAKLICVKSLKERVVGLHVLGPNAGEITQGWTVGIKLHATKADFDASIGIHPTCAEVFTTLTVTKSSGVDSTASAC